MQKVIIVDDEVLVCFFIREYFVDYFDFIILQECNNGVDVVNVINNFKLSIVFLDI